MVKLKCCESMEECTFETQNLPFDQADKLLDMHMARKHPVEASQSNPKQSQGGSQQQLLGGDPSSTKNASQPPATSELTDKN